MQKWPDDQRGGCSHLEFFYKKLKIKKLGAIWKVLDTIGQIENI